MRPVIFCILPLLAFVVFPSESIRSMTGEKKGSIETIKVSPVFEKYLRFQNPDLSLRAFQQAYSGFRFLKKNKRLKNDTILTIIDYSKPSNEKRLFILDMKNMKVVEESLVAHGSGSGELSAISFSNTPRSHQSSLGFFITRNTYQGKHGYSLRIEGVEKGINDNALKRALVFHGAKYVSYDFIKKHGRLGRSFGCPALPVTKSNEIINIIRNKTCVFVYSHERNDTVNSETATSEPLFQAYLQ